MIPTLAARRRLTKLSLLATVLLTSGCSGSRDDRLADFAQSAAERQAQQNEAMAANTQRVAAAAEELVRADAQARDALLQANREQQSAHRAWQAEIAEVRAQFHRERQLLVAERQRDQLTATAVHTLAMVLTALLPLLLAGYLLHLMCRPAPDDRALNEVLLVDLASERPRLLPSHSVMRLGPPGREEDQPPTEVV